ncbi:MAG: dihydroorotase family protein [Planctomycetes bacterium]|nr:dihydroorotase family protein [Planctomycetota bacterium]
MTPRLEDVCANAPPRRYALAGGNVYRGGRFERLNIIVEKDKIAALTGDPVAEPHCFDARDVHILPGLLDIHVHFREPGLERKEGWASGSRGALHGGVTSVLEIQNNPPLTVSLERLLERESIVQKHSLVDFGLFPNLLSESAGELIKMAPRVPGFKLFMGGSTGVGGVTDYGLLRDLFAAAAAAGRPVVVHAEEESLLRRDGAKYTNIDARSHHLARSTEAETLAIAAAIELAAATGASLHIFHISTGRGADLLAQGKASGVRVSGSTSPHYLLLTNEIAGEIGNFAKVNPSIKTARDRDRLCERLADGTLDAIGTDHAPHPVEEKNLPYAQAPSGLPVVDLVYPLLFEIAARGVPFSRLLDSMTAAAAGCFGIHNKSGIAVGGDADLVLMHPDAERAVAGAALPSKSKWSPYEGRRLRGFPQAVIRRGELLFMNGDYKNAGPARRLELDPPETSGG